MKNEYINIFLNEHTLCRKNNHPQMFTQDDHVYRVDLLND